MIHAIQTIEGVTIVVDAPTINFTDGEVSFWGDDGCVKHIATFANGKWRSVQSFETMEELRAEVLRRIDREEEVRQTESILNAKPEPFSLDAKYVDHWADEHGIWFVYQVPRPPSAIGVRWYVICPDDSAFPFNLTSPWNESLRPWISNLITEMKASGGTPV